MSVAAKSTHEPVDLAWMLIALSNQWLVEIVDHLALKRGTLAVTTGASMAVQLIGAVGLTSNVSV